MLLLLIQKTKGDKMTPQEIRNEAIKKATGYKSIMNSIKRINANSDNISEEFDIFLSKLETGRELGKYIGFNDEGFGYTLNNNKLVITKDNIEFSGEDFLDIIFNMDERMEIWTETLHDKQRCVCCHQYEPEVEMSYSDFSKGFICPRCIDGGRYVWVSDLIPISQLHEFITMLK